MKSPYFDEKLFTSSSSSSSSSTAAADEQLSVYTVKEG